VPGGGVPVWSRALLGRIVKSALGALKVTTWTVGLPAYICALLSANTRLPMNAPPAAKPNMLADM
jgi:hypothetical protein